MNNITIPTMDPNLLIIASASMDYRSIASCISK